MAALVKKERVCVRERDRGWTLVFKCEVWYAQGARRRYVCLQWFWLG